MVSISNAAINAKALERSCKSDSSRIFLDCCNWSGLSSCKMRQTSYLGRIRNSISITSFNTFVASSRISYSCEPRISSLVTLIALTSSQQSKNELSDTSGSTSWSQRTSIVFLARSQQRLRSMTDSISDLCYYFFSRSCEKYLHSVQESISSYFGFNTHGFAISISSSNIRALSISCGICSAYNYECSFVLNQSL